MYSEIPHACKQIKVYSGRQRMQWYSIMEHAGSLYMNEISHICLLHFSFGVKSHKEAQ